MRTSLYLIGFASASIVSAGAVGFGCSSSSSPAQQGTPDSGTTETSTPTESGTEDAASDASEDVAAEACTPIVGSMPVNDLDASAFAACSMACQTSLTTCAGDCDCNNTILTALLCTNGGMNALTCFGTAAASTNMNVSAVVACLTNNPVACAAPATDGGDAATAPSEAGSGDTGTGGDAADAGH